jgi:F420-0:gamma-glutamyl ligase
MDVPLFSYSCSPDSTHAANGDTIEELLEEYPSLEREDILACLDYVASLAEEQVTPIEALASAI